MSKYDSLDARTELEQIVTLDLNGAFQKRGLTVTHMGFDYYAPDNEESDRQYETHRETRSPTLKIPTK